MKIAIVDLETTGFMPKGLIVEVGIVELDLETGETTTLYDKLVKENGFSDEHRNSWIFENSDLKFEEVEQADPLDVAAIQKILDRYPATAYNKRFDFGFFNSRGIRITELDCPMLLATSICKLPGKFGKHKWPTVEEVWEHFFPDKPYVEAHRGADDALHEAKIVHELYKLGVFKVPNSKQPVQQEPKPGRKHHCEHCNKEIVWLKTRNNTNHPFDALKVLVAVKGTDNKTHVVLGHVSHFATCPNADEHLLN